MKIALIREGKIPTDTRVPLTPEQCRIAMRTFPVSVVAETSPNRCFLDNEYREHDVSVVTDVSDCDILMGVKEVPLGQLIHGKTYFIFSHTIKKQPYNQKLLMAVLDKNIRLIDYEVLKNRDGQRLIAFGYFAGMVGAHNGIWSYLKRIGCDSLKRMKDFKDYEEATRFYRTLDLPPMKVVLTGTGRVSSGAARVLKDLGIMQVAPGDFLTNTYKQPVFTQLDSSWYVARKDGALFKKEDFYGRPDLFRSNFAQFYKRADIFINGIYWNRLAPAFFTLDEMSQPDFKIQVVADVTCDIAPEASVPSTIRASSIADPVYGFDPATGCETPPFLPGSVDVMAIDNLPSELPRDASTAFGNQFLKVILPELFKKKSEILEKATIAENGHLTPHFRYLEDYAAVCKENSDTLA